MCLTHLLTFSALHIGMASLKQCVALAHAWMMSWHHARIGLLNLWQMCVGHKSTAPMTTIGRAAAMSVFARLLLHNGNFFLEIFAQAGGLGPSNSHWPDSFLKFLDQWLDR